MRIAFIVNDFPALSETFILNQITGLIDRGHDVHVYGYLPKSSSKLHPDVEKYNILKHTYYPPTQHRNYIWRFFKGLKLIFINYQKAPLVVVRSLNIFKYGRYAASLRLLYAIIPFLHTKEPYDIIHCQFGNQGINGMILRDIGAIQGKLVTSLRGFDISLFLRIKGEHVYDELFAKGDFFLANCEFFQKRAIKLGCEPKKITVHGSGINCDRFEFKARKPDIDGTIRIATTGRLVEKKGIEYSIRAVGKALKNYQKIEYNIIGDGELKEELEQVIQGLGIGKRVKILGWKNQREIIEILNKSHIFIAPCVTAKNGNQDAPVNTLKEAMAMGLPVISTFHGGIPELVEDGISGFLVPERDADAIANKINYLIDNPELWEKMGKAGRAYVEAKYDINKLNDELVGIYQQIIANEFQSFQIKQREVNISPKYI